MTGSAQRYTLQRNVNVTRETRHPKRAARKSRRVLSSCFLFTHPLRNEEWSVRMHAPCHDTIIRQSRYVYVCHRSLLIQHLGPPAISLSRAQETSASSCTLHFCTYISGYKGDRRSVTTPRL